ncbi:MAG: sensor histidine kinase [Campylobacteraceae bacterium]|nr:sensor histidine kinase [Campylobacteraceae bacterium]
MKIVKDFIQNVENYKVYNLILVTTVAFIVLMINSFYYIKEQFKELTEQKKVLVLKSMEHELKTWLSERITNIENSAKFINEIYDDEEKFKAFSTTFMRKNRSFDALQLLVPGQYLYVNDIKFEDYVEHYTTSRGKRRYYKDSSEELWYLNLKWYKDTKKEMRTTIESMREHGFFGVKTINICTPLERDDEFKGIYCGVIKADSLFNRIKSLQIPKSSYYLIMDKNGEVLANNSAFKLEKIKKMFAENLTSDLAGNIRFDNGVITVEKFDDFGWYIVVGINEDDIEDEATKVFLKHAALIFVFFIIFIAVINGSYTFLHSRANTKRIEYEKMLEYGSRMSEVGELVSAINHQLRQPLNSLALIVSSTLKLSSNKTLDKKTLESNLKLSKKSITIMDKTINIFRNFYRSDSTISEFSLKNTINNVLQVMHTSISQKNITVDMYDENIKSLKIISMENFVQQILLVLLQNAVDAIMPMNGLKDLDKRKIEIRFEVREENIDIDVIDFGCGIKKGLEKSIFSALYKSDKQHGFGMGLFFAKKLANKKLMGDISLFNSFNPTIFRFTVRRFCKV